MGKIYFASDFHLGYGSIEDSRRREIRIVKWLQSIESDCDELYLVGDVFDYWFEYRKAIPKGYVRFLGQLAKMIDRGMKCHLFVGNHDMWIGAYLVEEIGVTIYYDPIQIRINDHTFFIGHGDGLGPGDHTYKFIKPIMRNKWVQWIYGLLHPNLGLALMKKVSSSSRHMNGEEPVIDMNEEWLVQFAEEQLSKEHIDYFIFGHRHVPIDHRLSNNSSRYINLGDWLEFCSFAIWDRHELSLQFYDNKKNFRPLV